MPFLSVDGSEHLNKNLRISMKAGRQKQRGHSYTALKRMACNNFRWKAAKQSDFEEYKGGKRKVKECYILSILSKERM
jgi:hypothetical protein